MARIKNNNKRNYDKYKAEGRLERNKKKKQERHEKRLQKFAEKRASGNGYEYSKEHTQAKIKSFENYPDCDMNVFNQYDHINKKWKDGGCKCEYSRVRSVFAKLDNEMNKAKAAAKARIEKSNFRRKRRVEDESRD